MAFSRPSLPCFAVIGTKSHQLNLPREQLAHIGVIFDNENFLHAQVPGHLEAS